MREENIAETGRRPQAYISCSGARALVYLFLIYYGFKILASLAIILGICLGKIPMAAQLADGDWRLFIDTPLQGIYNSFPAQWAGQTTAIADPGLCAGVLLFLGIISELLPVFLILLAVRSLLGQVLPGVSPFTKRSTQALRTAGILFICMGVFGELLMQVGLSAIVFHHLYMENPWNLPYVFVGLLLLVLAQIFQYGCELQEEADLTI